MDIKKIQEMINETNYWDRRILDIKSNFFGDEINIYIEVQLINVNSEMKK